MFSYVRWFFRLIMEELDKREKETRETLMRVTPGRGGDAAGQDRGRRGDAAGQERRRRGDAARQERGRRTTTGQERERRDTAVQERGRRDTTEQARGRGGDAAEQEWVLEEGRVEERREWMDTSNVALELPAVLCKVCSLR